MSVLQKTVRFDFGVADFSALDCANIAECTLVAEAPELPLIILSSWMELGAKNQVSHVKLNSTGQSS